VELTTKQAAIFGYIRLQVAQSGRAPTIREIGDHAGIRSPNGVVSHLKSLERKGFIRIEPGIARGITIVRSEASTKGMEDMARVMLEFHPTTVPGSLSAGTILDTHAGHRLVVASVTAECESFGQTLAAAPAMRIALEAVSEWYRSGGPDVSDPPMDMVHAALGLAHRQAKESRGT
jgi:SOS-response transcriptional repressor LexA